MPRTRFAAPPRIVVVTRPTELSLLLARHGTREQARFHLAQRGLRIEEVEARHHLFEAVLAEISRAIPLSFRRARIGRDDLARFVFEPADVIVAVGQDGLVANVAKYVEGQPVIGINPDPTANRGVLVRHAPEQAEDLVRRAGEDRLAVEPRAMVEVVLDDGQRLRALNEIYLGHRTHQSARYVIAAPGRGEERHSSSGVVVATGTGATGWALSIARARRRVAAPRSDRPLARVLRARGLPLPGHRDRAHGRPRGGRPPPQDPQRDERGRRGVRRRNRGRPTLVRLGCRSAHRGRRAVALARRVNGGSGTPPKTWFRRGSLLTPLGSGR
jgi:NAD kinase